MTPTSWLCVMGDAGYIYPHWLYLQCVLWPQHAPRGRLPSYKRKSILEWNGILVKFWNGILKISNTARVFGQYPWVVFEFFEKGNIQKIFRNTEKNCIRLVFEYRKKVDIQKIFRNTEKNFIRVVLRSTDVFSGTKRKKKNVLLTDVSGGGYNIPLLYRVFITININQITWK